ncbi:MAG: T9SS type A sorting domain-containing protein [Bacteroidetes bacterium]|jgi:hypothetical protein|nr:T9SS type A sorting domain-containing protein [Bacteroidota bacterium]
MSRSLLLAGLCIGLVALLAERPAASQPFTFTFVETTFPSLSYGAVGFADVDRDGRFDIAAAGNTSRFQPFVPEAFIAYSREEALVVEENQETWRHTYEQEPLSAQMWHARMAWQDADGDGDVDLAMTGTTQPQFPFAARTVFYDNEDGTLVPVETALPDLYGGAVAWGDVDNDGDADLLLTGSTSDDAYVTALYRNDGGTFSAVEAGLRDVAFGDAAWGDVDNDGDLDLVLSGADNDGGFFTDLYRNDAGTFTRVEAGLEGLAFTSVDWGDYDNDGDLDLVLTGGELSPQVLDGVIQVYRNDGGTLTPIDLDLDGIVYGAAAWGDYDSDGDLDLYVSGGRSALGTRLTRVYQNQGSGRFAYVITLPSTAIVSSLWGDYDSDGDLDLLSAGLNSSGSPLTTLYRNDYRIVNTPPTPPDGLQATTQGGTATLSWTAATDEQMPQAGLTYTLRVGTAPGGTDVVAPMADPETGYRYVPGRGNVDHNTQWTLRNLPEGTYYWSVQAVDGSYKGSPFAEEGSFTIQNAGGDGVSTDVDEEETLPTRLALHPAYPNPLRETATLRYDLPDAASVTLTVYNVLGAQVARLVDRVQPAGRQQVSWNGTDASGRRVSAGVYFVRMQAGTSVRSQQLVVVR